MSGIGNVSIVQPKEDFHSSIPGCVEIIMICTRTGEDTEHDPGGKVKLPIPSHWNTSAYWFGKNREYRQLVNYWWSDGPILLGALMNPSVANEYFLDPTLAKFGRLAAKWGYGGFSIVNACDYRCTNSKLLSKIANPCSDSNLAMCASAANQAAMILVGYGKLHKNLQHHASAMVAALRLSGKPLYVLAVNKDGSPKHPLYISESTLPVIYS